MSRHRDVRRRTNNYNDEYDDVYGTSYGTSYDEDMCVSPGTMSQFTFKRRSSDDEQRRPHLDSISESDRDYDVDIDMEGLDIQEVEVPVQEVAKTSEYPKPRTAGEALKFELEKIELIEADHVMKPLLLQVTQRKSTSKRQRSSKLSSLLRPRKSKAENWFIPIPTFMKFYTSSHIYWFNFDAPSQRTVLSRNFKGKLPTPINEVNAEAIVSRTGQRVNFGPNSKNEVPEKLTDDAFNAIDAPSASKKKLLSKPLVAQTRDASPVNKNDTPSSPSMRRAAKEATVVKPDVEYEKNRKDSKSTINVVVIGHVDAGKSTLMGRLLVDMGYVPQKVMHRNEQDSKKMGKSSFLYAWVLDETEEERSRGITMDVAQSKFETTNRKITILDAPGHKDFIPNMITGAAQADVALLVVGATVGEFEAGFDAGGQTREHTMLIRSLGVSQLAVVVNKLDNVNWNQKRYDEIVEKLKVFLRQTGFKESDVTFVPCSGLSGENLSKKSELSALKSWYNGPCLVDVIDSFRPPERPVTKPTRIIITDMFKGQVSGVCVSARIDSGFVQIGQKLVILPSSESCSVKSITIDDESVNQAFAGDNITLIMLGCDHNNISIGNVICDPTSPCPVTTKFEARIVVFNSVHIPVTKGLPVVFHFGSTSEQAVIKKLISQLNRSTGQVVKKHPRCLTKNTSGVVVIEVARPVCVEKYAVNKNLGRFMLRYSGDTIVAGLIDNIL